MMGHFEEIHILQNSRRLQLRFCFLPDISCMFFPMLGLLCILRYTIQGVGFTNLAMFSGVAEMIARILVSLYAVPVFGFIAVCYGDPMAWIAADLFLVPAFIYVYRRLKKQVFTNSQVTQTVA